MAYLWVKLELNKVTWVGGDLFGTECELTVLPNRNDVHDLSADQATQ